MRPKARAAFLSGNWRLALLGLAVVALPVRPAGAALTIVTNWRSPAADATVADALDVDLDVSFELSDVYRVRRWRMRLVDGSDTTLLCNASLPTSQKTAHVQFTWDTRYEPRSECADGVAAVDGTRLANGAYTLELTAWEQVTNGDGNAGTATRSIVVDNAPAVPEGLVGEFDATVQSVVLSWQPNQEPDLTGYRVEQCYTTALSDPCDDLWTEVAAPDPAVSSATVPVGVPGAYRYRVQARRTSGSGSGETVSSYAEPEQGIYLAPTDDGTGTTTLDEDDDGSGGGSARSGSGGGGDDDDGSGGGGSSDGGSSTGGPIVSGGSSASGGGSEARRSLPSRLVRRADVEDSYKEALPYSDVLPGEEGPLGLVTDGGAGTALVPIAGGALAIVFALQMRYLSRRSSLLDVQSLQ